MRHAWPLYLVLALATILRLYSLDTIDLRYDEASAAQFALSIANGNLLAVAPFSGSVANHPPVYLYILAVPYLFSRSFLVVAVYRVMLDVVAIGLLWAVARRYFNARVAFMAALFFAVSPWAVQFARKLWLAPLPLFSVILLWGLLAVVIHRNPWGWAIAGWGLALAIGTHLSALFLAPVFVIMLALNWRTLRPLPLFTGLVPMLALGMIYLANDSAHAFSNVHALLTASSQEGIFSLNAARFALWISGGAHLSDLTDGAYSAWVAQVPSVLNWLDTVQLGLLCAGFAYSIIQIGLTVHKRDWAAMRLMILLAAWMLVPVVLQLQPARPVQVHYLTPLYPVPFVLMALPIDRITTWTFTRPQGMARKGIFAAVSSLTALILFWQVFTTFRFDDFVAVQDTSHGGYGQPVRAGLAVAALAQSAICQDTGCGIVKDAPGDVIVMTPGGDPLVNEQATIMNVVLAGIPHRFANSDAGLIFPSRAAQYIITPGAEKALGLLIDNLESGGIQSRTFPVRSGYQPVYTYVTSTEPVRHDYLPASAHWPNGISLQGYRATLQDNALLLDVLLHVDSEPTPGMDYHWYNHVLAQGVQIAQMDGGGIQAVNWRKGDTLLQRFQIPMPQPAPPGPYIIRIGSYLYPSIQIVQATLSNNQTSDSVDLVIKQPTSWK